MALFPFNSNHTLLCYGILFINTIPFIQPHVTNIILFLYNFFSLAVENSPESSYVPGSFSAKGRSKLRSPNSVTPVAPANLDKAINQVCVLYINKLKIMNKKVIILKNEKKIKFSRFQISDWLNLDQNMAKNYHVDVGDIEAITDAIIKQKVSFFLSLKNFIS